MYDIEECQGNWIAPYEDSNDYGSFTYDQKRYGRNFLPTSVTFIVSTQCYPKEPSRIAN